MEVAAKAVAVVHAVVVLWARLHSAVACNGQAVPAHLWVSRTPQWERLVG
jgi:hypothetical protein